MTPAQARDRILRGIERANHVEPFRHGGVTYGARLPTLLQMSAADMAHSKLGGAGWLASLATQCTELNGELVFQPNDLSALLGDHPHGFLAAFQRALLPLIQPPVQVPTLSGPVDQ